MSEARPFAVEVVRRAAADVDGLGEADRQRIVRGLRALETDPFRPRPGCDVARLAGHPGVFRLRVGDWRIFYSVDLAARVVTVTRFERRRRAYR